MSLINEALKRAKQAPVRPPAPVASDPLLQPVMQAPPAVSPFLKTVPVVAVLILLASFWFLFQWWRHAAPPKRVAVSSPPVTNRLVAAVQVARTTASLVSSNRAAAAADVAAFTAAPDRQAKSPVDAAPAVASGDATNEATIVSLAAPANAAPNLAGALAETNRASATPSEPEVISSNLKLQGIFYRTSRACALIDGQTVFVGDEVDGAKVISIERQKVRLERGDKRIHLTLH
ncbi:MAG: hypothetical protein U1G07_23965 [Verrucomicrobiota bacterium]